MGKGKEEELKGEEQGKGKVGRVKRGKRENVKR